MVRHRERTAIARPVRKTSRYRGLLATTAPRATYDPTIAVCVLHREELRHPHLALPPMPALRSCTSTYPTQSAKDGGFEHDQAASLVGPAALVGAPRLASRRLATPTTSLPTTPPARLAEKIVPPCPRPTHLAPSVVSTRKMRPGTSPALGTTRRPIGRDGHTMRDVRRLRCVSAAGRRR